MAAFAAAILMDSDSTEGALGGRLLASFLGGQFHHEDVSQPYEVDSDDLANQAAAAICESDDEDTAIAAAATLCDSENEDGALGGRLLSALLGGQQCSNNRPIPTIPSPFTAEYFSQIPQDWIHPNEGDEVSDGN